MNTAELLRTVGDNARHVLAMATDLKSQSEKVDALHADIDKLYERLAALDLNGGGTARGSASMAAVNAALGKYARQGESASLNQFASAHPDVQAAMRVASDPDGGYTAEPEVDTTIR